jgi:hypothetical protein
MEHNSAFSRFRAWINTYSLIFSVYTSYRCRSRWPRGLRRGSAAALLRGLGVRIPAGTWMSVCCECCVYCQAAVSASGCSLVQMSPAAWSVSEWDREASVTSKTWPTRGCYAGDGRGISHRLRKRKRPGPLVMFSGCLRKFGRSP